MRLRNSKRETGTAIAAVLWLTLLLSLLATVVIKLGTSANLATEANLAQARLSNAADAGLAMALEKLIRQSERGAGSLHKSTFQVQLNQASVEVTFINEASKLNINRASRAQLLSLFDELGLKRRPASDLASEIMARRAPLGSASQVFGRRISARGGGSGIRSQGPFISKSSLARIEGVDGELLARIKAKISLSSPVAKGQFEDTAGKQIGAGLLQPRSLLPGHVFTVLAKAVDEDGRRLVKEILVRWTGAEPTPYQILSVGRVREVSG